MNRDQNNDYTETVTNQGAANRRDPVDLAIDALAAPRWSGSPDWRNFQEQLMTHRKSFWRRTSVLSLLACGVLAAGAAVAWQWFPISGTFNLNSGGSTQVTGEMATVNGGESFEANINTGGVDISGGGSMEITMPDGSKATLVVESGNRCAAPPAGKKD